MILITKTSDQTRVCVCVMSSHLFWTSGLWTYQPGSHRRKEGFFHLPCVVLALTFLARKIQPFRSLVDHEVKFCVLAN